MRPEAVLGSKVRVHFLILNFISVYNVSRSGAKEKMFFKNSVRCFPEFRALHYRMSLRIPSRAELVILPENLLQPAFKARHVLVIYVSYSLFYGMYLVIGQFAHSIGIFPQSF